MEKITYRVLSRLYRTEKCGFEEIQQITGKNESISPSNYIAALMAAGYIRNWSSSENGYLLRFKPSNIKKIWLICT